VIEKVFMDDVRGGKKMDWTEEKTKEVYEAV